MLKIAVASCHQLLVFIRVVGCISKGRVFHFFPHIFRDHLNRNDLTSGLKTCRTFGPQKPDLWIQALQAVCLSVTATEEQLMEIIDEVEELRLLSPIQIIDMMEMSDNVTMETAG